MIDGYVCKVGRKHGIPTPFCDKVVEIVEKISAKQLPLSDENLKQFPSELFTYTVAQA